ncbi:hypothetical protein Nepgr_009156 [Nepenthes gracilis]|uniref:DUF7054 domain-containing protein n=1 Tax=Nepenthes gracilis TaxID=150966 RepID=A0AAD3SAF9_NEPGR|nr:hypothetical protein Nepgr_009156 [Nepenthes gracilis]
MPNSKPQRKGGYDVIKNGKGKSMPEKAVSFHGRGITSVAELRRLQTLPADLPSFVRGGVSLQANSKERPRLTKVLLNVTIQGSLGAVQVLMSPELAVDDLIAAAVSNYVKDRRRPVLPTSRPFDFDLHYSQFSLESLNREAKLAGLGSRNFFLCKKKVAVDGGGSGSGDCGVSSCSKEAEKGTKFGLLWLQFMNFLQ